MRLEAPEVVAGATPAGLDLVGDEKDPVLVEDIFQSSEKPVGRHNETADPLYGFGDQAGHVSGGRGLDYLSKVSSTGGIERVVAQARERPPKTIAVVEVAHL